MSSAHYYVMAVLESLSKPVNIDQVIEAGKHATQEAGKNPAEWISWCKTNAEHLVKRLNEGE